MAHKLFVVASVFLALVSAVMVYVAVSQYAYSEVRDEATAEAKVIVAVTDGFIRTYSEVSREFGHGKLPIPATF